MNENRTYIIAEAGVNHNGSLEMALDLVDAAADAGADAVKFQTFKADKEISRYAPKADYQYQATDASESQLEMLKKLELTLADHRKLIERCGKRGIEFISTPFDLTSLDMLAKELDLRLLKISSGDITTPPLLFRAASYGKSLIISTGMSTLGEIEDALGILALGYTKSKEKPSLAARKKAFCTSEGQKALQEKVILLHCTTEYPANFGNVNLRAMDTISRAFGLKVGLSDHTAGISVAIAAAARGAAVIEKHFTLDRKLPGPDHQASMEPAELRSLIQAVREVEEALGSALKIPVSAELKNITVIRKSLVAARNIKAGEKFTEENLTVKRVGKGVSALEYWAFLDKYAERDYQEDEAIS